MNNLRHKASAIFMVFMLVLTTAVPVFASEGKTVPDAIRNCSAYMGYDFKLTFDNASDWLSAITDVKVGDTAYEKTDYSSNVWNNAKYFINKDDGYLMIGEGAVPGSGTATCVITAEGYADLTLELNKSNHTATIVASSAPSEGGQDGAPVQPGESDKGSAQAPVFTNVSSGFASYYQLTFSDTDYVSRITAVLVNGTPCETGFSLYYLSGTQYMKDAEKNNLYLASTSWSSSTSTFKDGDIVTIQNEQYQDLVLKVTKAGDLVTIAPVSADKEDGYTLYVRLTGYFESALVNQTGYDAISGASTNVTQNQNSNAQVEAVLVEKGTALSEVSENDWKPLNESGITVDKQQTKVNLDSASGMVGVYSTYDSSVTLAGTPAKEGVYEVSVTVTDDQGRTAISNQLSFKVYSGEETLYDQMVIENFRDGEAYWDGKYIWDLEPWAIQKFGGTNETVTVPLDLKAIYGSNTSGTYGELGYAIPEGAQTTQTLIIPSGCNLTLVNMDVLSSVRIKVEKGGNLTLMDSVIQGVVEVDGGSFSMYDSSSINGQVILNDGSTLNASVIYSNTNYIANGNEARHNTAPVIVVNGTVTQTGNVYIRGDESPTGTDPDTGKEYAGQTGLQVNGTLRLSEDSVLAVYGGGHYYTTSVGGAAIVLNNGTITGEGKLIALGGTGTKEGGNAVEGTGTVSVANVYLQGGNSAYKDTLAGKALTDTVTLANTTNRTLVDGIVNGGFEVSNYWGSITNTPDLTQYTVETNAPGDTVVTVTKPTASASSSGTAATKSSNTVSTVAAQTGDTSNAALWIALSLLATAIGIWFLAIFGKKCLTNQR